MRREPCLLKWREEFMASTRKSGLWPWWPFLLLLYNSFLLHVFLFCVPYFYCLNIFVAVMVWWSLSSSVSSCCLSFTCIQSLCQKTFSVKCNVIYMRLAASNCLLSSSFLTHALILDILLCHVSTTMRLSHLHLLLYFIHLHSGLFLWWCMLSHNRKY